MASEEQLRRLTARLIIVREEERARIARSLHDDLGQSLTMLKMNCSWAADRLSDAPFEVMQRLRASIQLADNTIRAARALSTELRPGILDLGLVAALEWQAEDFQARTEIECSVEFREGDMLDDCVDPAAATMIFRIFQELLTNIERHSGAANARVHLRRAGSELLLEVEDDGRGITTEEIESVASVGLSEIRERVAAINGTFLIGRKSEKGTVAMIRVPLETGL